MIKLNYSDEREWMVKRDKNKDTKTKDTQVQPLWRHDY